MAMIESLLVASLRASNRQRREVHLKEMLTDLMPSIEHQYSTVTIPPANKYLNEKVRCQHSFQMSLILEAARIVAQTVTDRKMNVVDIGDSAGTHVFCLRELSKKLGIAMDTFSVNLDSAAVERIKEKGLAAFNCRAEDVHRLFDLKPDLFVCLETLEHLVNPIGFLRDMASKGAADYFAITVPYQRQSKVGLHYLRDKLRTANAENTHIFELSPTDWKSIFQFSGWELVHEDIYLQYPRRHILTPMKYLWLNRDFEGFYGVILKRNLELSDHYSSW